MAGWWMKLSCAEPLEGPLSVSILAVFPCPKSEYLKRTPRPIRWHTKKNGDVDNIAKAVLDAGNSILWLDDSQVAMLHVGTVIAAQGDAPSVRVEVHTLDGDPQCRINEESLTVAR
jgi:Holliday junction resolvase RusA-like endonuclease